MASMTKTPRAVRFLLAPLLGALTPRNMLVALFVLLTVWVPSSLRAAAIGSPPGGFVIPAGATASVTNVGFGACNALSWGYQLNGGPEQVQAQFSGGCVSQSEPSVTIGPFSTDQTLLIFLQDDHCGVTYYSDGTPVDHVIVSGSNPYSIRFADGGGFCERVQTTTNTFSGYNFEVQLQINLHPIARFTATVHPGGLVQFDATSSTPGSPQDSVTGYGWSFGDGSGVSSTSPITTHTFAWPDKPPTTFEVTLVVTDSSGATSDPATYEVNTCAPDVSPTNGVEYAGLVACVEVANPQESPRQILSTMRQLYYGNQPWTIKKHEPKWNTVIPCGLSVPDPTPSLDPKLINALVATANAPVAETDMSHLFTGLEAMECPSDQVVFQPIFGVPATYWTVNMPNYIFASWGGDIGSAVAVKTFDSLQGNPYPWSYYIGPAGIKAGDDDLYGDVDGLVLHYAEADQPCAVVPAALPWTIPLSEVLRDYYGADSGGYHQTRMQCLAQILALSTTNGQVIPQQMMGMYGHEVYDFALAYYAEKFTILIGPSVLTTLRANAFTGNPNATGIFANWINTHS